MVYIAETAAAQMNSDTAKKSSRTDSLPNLYLDYNTKMPTNWCLWDTLIISLITSK